MIWQDESPPRRSSPTDATTVTLKTDLGAIKADLEFLIERATRFRKEQALKPVYTLIGSAAIVIAWIELFSWHCL
jgi:hypothetical protein